MVVEECGVEGNMEKCRNFPQFTKIQIQTHTHTEQAQNDSYDYDYSHAQFDIGQVCKSCTHRVYTPYRTNDRENFSDSHSDIYPWSVTAH